MRKLFIGSLLWVVSLGVQAGSFLGDADAIARQLVAVAQTTANTAVSNAATADGKAVAAQTTANTAVSNAATADGKAVAAQTTANTAVSNAATAQTTANTAVSNAATAQTTASTAVSNALGYGQTWQNVIGSRVGGVNYTNSTGKPIEWCIRGTNGSLPTISVCGVVLGGLVAAGYDSGSCFIVPNGCTYGLSLASTIANWVELR